MENIDTTVFLPVTAEQFQQIRHATSEYPALSLPSEVIRAGWPAERMYEPPVVIHGLQACDSRLSEDGPGGRLTRVMPARRGTSRVTAARGPLSQISISTVLTPGETVDVRLCAMLLGTYVNSGVFRGEGIGTWPSLGFFWGGILFRCTATW